MQDLLRADIDRLRKENATCCLQLIDRAFSGTAEDALAELEKGKTDPEVLALVRAFHSFPLGECAICGRPAPVRDNGHFGAAFCAWGCPV